MATAVDDMLVLDVPDGIYGGRHEWIGMVHEDISALLAATFPAKPPISWFRNPALRVPTPLTVQSDGQVFGHIATWNTTHIGLAGGVRPPKSRSRYAFFATGALETAEGEHINVGQLTLVGGHASLEASVAEAVAHYDNTDSAWADVAVGEDKLGVWVAGALRPDVDESRLRAIRASSVSGDWRPINNNLELVAVCCVNVPGFPVPRARVASGATLALVAAGTEELVRASVLQRAGLDIGREVEAGLATMAERLDRVEGALLDRADRSRRSPEVATAVQEAMLAGAYGQVDQLQAMRDKVHKKKVMTASAVHLDALRERVHPTLGSAWDDGMPMEVSIQDAVVASLRARAHGEAGLVATATSTWTSKKREEAIKRGWSMSDGSFPIKDCRDVEKAASAMGRSKHSSAGVKRHIMKRARALSCTSHLPKAWQDNSA